MRIVKEDVGGEDEVNEFSSSYWRLIGELLVDLNVFGGFHR